MKGVPARNRDQAQASTPRRRSRSVPRVADSRTPELASLLGSGPTLSHQTVLQLQRTLGNGATSALIRSGARTPGRTVRGARRSNPYGPRTSAFSSIHRYGSGEHAQLGGGVSVKINGVTVSEGELIALGDFYEKPGDLYDADPAELQRLVDLIRRDRGAAEGTGGKAVGEEEWEAATTGPGRKGKSYLELAKANEGHFAPGTGAGTENHYDKWKKFHLEALEKAAEAGAAGADLPDEAIAINGFACHFLTDAFASGHIVAKKLITDKAESAWAKQGTTGMIFKESAFTKSVGKAVLGDPAVARRLAGKQLKLVKWGDIDSTRFSEFLWQMAGKAPGDFFNGFAKTTHDALNESISKTPIDVENKRGDKWTLSGDSTLALSPDTKQIAKAAVEESFRNLVTVAKANESFDYTPLLERVWAYTPKPTTAGQAEVDKILKDLTDPNNAESQRRFAELAISNIEILVSELEGQGYMRDKPAAPTPAPRSGFPAFEPKF